MNFITKTIVTSLLIAGISQQIVLAKGSPRTYMGAALGAIGAGAGTGVAIGGGIATIPPVLLAAALKTCGLCNKNIIIPVALFTTMIGTVSGLLTGIAVSGVSFTTLIKQIPSVRLAYINKIIQKYNQYSLLQNTDLFRQVFVQFSTSSWPLIEARNLLASISDNDIETAIAKAQLNINELENLRDEEYRKLYEKSLNFMNTLKTTQSNIKDYIFLLTTHPHYITQLSMYQKHIEEEERRKHELAMQEKQFEHQESLEEKKNPKKQAVPIR